MEANLTALLIVTVIAVVAPLIAELPVGVRLPIVVLEIILGILVGPHVLGWATADGVLGFLGVLGMTFLFFVAGMELEFGKLTGPPTTLALKSWGATLVLALILTFTLYNAGFLDAPVMIAIALTTTAIGTLLPILRDSGELDTRFGTFVLGAGAVGELAPILVISVILSRDHSSWKQTAMLILFSGIAAMGAFGAVWMRKTPVIRLLSRTMHASSQLPVRICILLLIGLVVMAEHFGLDMILGAFAAGMLVQLANDGPRREELTHKLEAISFGFLIPLFFVVSGIRFDLGALLESRDTLLRVPVFLSLLFVVRGVPTFFFYRKALGAGERLPFALYCATALPLVVAITEIGVKTGRMRTDNAAALVGAAMLSVLIFPLIALALRKKAGAAKPGQGRGEDFEAL